jgi:ATP-binding cassette subfamily B protein
LRALVGVVPQTVDLFDGTVLDNITPGDACPELERIVALCDAVGLREAIERMPQGWQTAIGERGAALSGGERQRLALVRALYREPAILILDEATAALDTKNEALVLDAVRRVASDGTTVLVIAHRPSILRIADRVLMLERGRLLEPGMPAALGTPYDEVGRLWSRADPSCGSSCGSCGTTST